MRSKIELRLQYFASRSAAHLPNGWEFALDSVDFVDLVDAVDGWKLIAAG